MTNLLRKIFNNLLYKIAHTLHSLGLKADVITLIGVIGNFLGAFFIGLGNLQLGGWMVFALGPIDAIDGSLARLEGGGTKSGAFLDSISDRYSELAIFTGLFIYSLNHSDSRGCILAFLASLGSIMVSYIRARAESLNVECKIGLLTRVERYLVIVPTLIFSKINIGLLIIAVLSHLTALQRIIFVHQKLKEKTELE